MRVRNSSKNARLETSNEIAVAGLDEAAASRRLSSKATHVSLWHLLDAATVVGIVAGRAAKGEWLQLGVRIVSPGMIYGPHTLIYGRGISAEECDDH